jgi:hypothetical protein
VAVIRGEHRARPPQRAINTPEPVTHSACATGSCRSQLPETGLRGRSRLGTSDSPGAGA